MRRLAWPFAIKRLAHVFTTASEQRLPPELVGVFLWFLLRSHARPLVFTSRMAPPSFSSNQGAQSQRWNSIIHKNDVAKTSFALLPSGFAHGLLYAFASCFSPRFGFDLFEYLLMDLMVRLLLESFEPIAHSSITTSLRPDALRTKRGIAADSVSSRRISLLPILDDLQLT